MVAISRSALFKAFVASSVSTSLHPLETISNQSEYKRYSEPAKFVRQEITNIIQNQDPAIAGSILRLSFHDAAVRSVASDPTIGGADGSVRYELEWSENRGLSKPLKVVKQVFESQQEKYCPTPVIPDNSSDSNASRGNGNCLSFADVLALSGAAAVEAAQGPNIPIKLGRKDVDHADNQFLDHPITSESERSTISTSLPYAGLDSLGLKNYFKRLGLTEQELVALSGAHDLGRHVTLLDMPKACLKNLTRTCLEDAPVLIPFVTADPDTLSNRYFQTLLRWNDREIEYGEALFIPTDVAMVLDEELKKHVIAFAKDEKDFFRKFRTAYQKLVDTTATSLSMY